MTADSRPCGPLNPSTVCLLVLKWIFDVSHVSEGRGGDKHKGSVLLNFSSSAGEKKKCRTVKKLFLEKDRISEHLMKQDTLEIRSWSHSSTSWIIFY